MPTTAPDQWRNRIKSNVRRDPAKLRANALNWRTHPPEQRAALERMLDDIGWVQSVIVNETTGNLVDGHLRVELAIERGEKSIPVGLVALDAEEERRVLAALDPLAAMAGVDTDRLEALLAEITLGEDDLSKMLADLARQSNIELSPPPLSMADADDVPSPPSKREIYVNPGELWTLGDHRLLVGDATSLDDVQRLMDGSTARMCFTDPPWNVEIVGGNHALQLKDRRARGGLEIANDRMSDDEYQRFIKGYAACITTVVTGDLYCVLGASEWAKLDYALRDRGSHWSSMIVWVKPSLVMTRSNYHQRHEPIWYGWNGRSSYQGSRSEDNVWEFPRPHRSEQHPTMKPVVLVERAIRNSSGPNDIVLDLFLGSGTTLIASERTGRRCYGTELDPGYAQVTIDRWQNYTGQKAERIG